MPSPRLLCVYCSSSPHLAPEYYAAAEALGEAMPARGWGLVYGGGKIGLMGAVARGVKRSGGAVIGVIPHFMKERELEFREADELHTVITMAERKAAMIARAQAYVALPGGIGTLEELVEQLTWQQLGRHAKPILIANIAGFWEPLLGLLTHMRATHFIRPTLAVEILKAERVEDFLPRLQAAAAKASEEAKQLAPEVVRRL